MVLDWNLVVLEIYKERLRVAVVSKELTSYPKNHNDLLTMLSVV